MPYPTTALVKPMVGASVSEYAIGPGRDGLIGLDVLPDFPRDKEEGTYGVLPREAFTIIPNTDRQAGGGYNRQSWAFEQATYSCEEHGLEAVLDDKKKRRYANLYDLEEVEAKKIAWQLELAREKRIADLCFGGSCTETAAAVKWSTAATATPKADVDAAKLRMRTATGLLPDSIALDWEPFLYLVRTDEVKDEVKYTRPITVEPLAVQASIMAAYFDVKQILICSRIYNTADAGQDFSGSALWDKTKVLVFKKTEPASGFEQPALGVSFRWNEDSPDLLVVEGYRDESIRSDVLRTRENSDEVLVSAALGEVIDTVL